MRIRKRTISLLPRKLPLNQFLLIDKLRRVVFNVPNQIRNVHRRSQPYKYMNMVGNTVYDNGFLIFPFNDSRNVFKNLITPRFLQKILSSFYCKDILYIYL